MKAKLLPQPVVDVSRRLREAGHRVFVTGGGVRDLLLERTPRDWDLATSASGEAVARLFPRINPVGLRHNTVGVFEGGMWLEVTTFRDPDITLEGDLAMRDFTVNAVALDPETAQVVDTLGGREDLARGVLRACVDPTARFSEDPLRILRAARFIAELGLKPTPDLTAAASSLHARVRECAVERVRDEWLKLLGGAYVRESFAWMTETGLFDLLFPAVGRGRGVEQNRYHRWDVYVHTVETVARAEPDPEVRLAAMFHDLGKPATRKWQKGDYTFYNHERVSAEIAEADLDHYRFGQRMRDRVVRLVANHMFHYEATWSDAAVRRFMRRIEPELLEPLFKLRMADSSATGMGREEDTAENLRLLRARIVEQQQAHVAMKVTDLEISGHDVIGLAGGGGPIVGQVLRTLLERVTDDPGLNERDRLLAEAARIVHELQG